VLIEVWLSHESLENSFLSVVKDFGDSFDLIFGSSSELDPLSLHSFAEANLSDFGSNLGFNIGLQCSLLKYESRSVKELWGSIISVLETLSAEFN
jgi:hypothetical protein